MIPVAKPLMDETEVQAAGRAIRSGWVTQGPEVAAFEREFADLRRGSPRLCRLQRHHRPAPGAPDRRRAPRRRGHHRQSLLHRHRQRRPLLRGAAGVRGHSARDLQHRPHANRGGDDPAHPGDPVRAPDRHAVRAPGHPGSGTAPTAGGRRGRGLRDRQRDPVGEPLGADRAAARRHRLLLVSPPQAGLDRRRRHDHDLQRRVGRRAPSLAAARHERAGHDPARRDRRSSSRPIPWSATTTA